MSSSYSFKMDAKTLGAKAAAARQRMGQATTTQERQHFEGMARYWEELLEEYSAAAGPAGISDVAHKLAGGAWRRFPPDSDWAPGMDVDQLALMESQLVEARRMIAEVGALGDDTSAVEAVVEELERLLAALRRATGRLSDAPAVRGGRPTRPPGGKVFTR